MQPVSRSLLSDVCPNDVLTHIFSYADCRSLLHLISTCKRFKVLIEEEASNRIWQLYVQYCHPYATSYLSKEAPTKQWIDLTRCCVSLDEKVATGHLPANFIEAFAKRRKLLTNTTANEVSASLRKRVQTTSDHLGFPVIKISDVNTGHLERMISAKDVKFCIDGNTLYLGSVHRPCIEAWDLETGEKGKTYQLPPDIEKTDLKLYPSEGTFFYAVVSSKALLIWDKTSEALSIPIQNGFSIKKILFLPETNNAYIFQQEKKGFIYFAELDLESKQISKAKLLYMFSDFIDARIEKNILFVHAYYLTALNIQGRKLDSDEWFSCYAYCFFNNTLVTLEPRNKIVLTHRNLDNLSIIKISMNNSFLNEVDILKIGKRIEISHFSPVCLLLMICDLDRDKLDFFIINPTEDTFLKLNLGIEKSALAKKLNGIKNSTSHLPTYSPLPKYLPPLHPLPSLLEDYVMRSADPHLPIRSSSILSLYNPSVVPKHIKVALTIIKIAAFCFPIIVIAALALSLFVGVDFSISYGFSLLNDHDHTKEIARKIGDLATGIIPYLCLIMFHPLQSWTQKKLTPLLNYLETIPARS